MSRWTLFVLVAFAGIAQALTLDAGTEVYQVFVLKDYCHAHYPELRSQVESALGDWLVRNRPAIERAQSQNDFPSELEKVRKAYEVATGRGDYLETCRKFPELLQTPEFNRPDFLRP